MKQVIASQVLEIPDYVKLEVRARKVRVKGKRGKLFQDHDATPTFLYLVLGLGPKGQILRSEGAVVQQYSLLQSFYTFRRNPDKRLQASSRGYVHI